MEESEQLYSRQIAAYGVFSMDKISKLKILIYGIRGIGIEICKNIILSGPKKVTIFDDNKIIKDDLGSNFYIEEKDIGLRRDEVSIKKLYELNNDVKCDYLKEGNLEENIKEYDILIITEIMEIDRIKRLNEICRNNLKGFIYSLVLGLSFYCFVDFGNHIINNKINNDIKKYFIKDIQKGKTTQIIIDNEFDNFNINEDQYILLKDIKGMNQLLDGKKRKIKNCENDKFELDEDSTNYDDYIQGGVVEEFIEEIEIIKNESFENLLNIPKKCENINENNIEINMHLAFLSLHEYYKKHKKLPENNKGELIEMMDITNNIYTKNENEWCKNINLEENLLNNIYKYAKCEISPLCGYGGGVVSQEIIKYIGIYKPINQWFRAEFYGVLDTKSNHGCIDNNSRYHDQLLLFGDEAQKKMEDMKIFMIGSGAVGCELLKYFAMMGISTSQNGLITITDHDRIEKSNLSRQFLFRENDIGKLKSECAINAIKQFNNKINCNALQELITKEIEIKFNKEFYEKQNVVIIAVDNFESRTYISERCESFGIPYFNCGTESSYANVEAFIPGKTEKPSYPLDDKRVVPSCTLKLFPSSINHCVLWTLNHFEKLFNKNIVIVKKMNNNIYQFYEDIGKTLDLRQQFYKIKKFYKLLKIANSKSFEKCIKYSIRKYHNFYINKINSILKAFPPDKISKETGLKFWTGNKILPHPLQFDINEKMCFYFIKSFSCLLAECLGIEIKNIKVDEYVREYSKNIKIKPQKTKSFEEKSFYEIKINTIKNEINDYLNKNKNYINYNQIHYEKDTTDINQINFICYASNLRAKNYNIENLENFKIKIIAGKIMPALITSTSSISGLLALQLYVLAQNSNCLNFRTGVIDLADNTLALGIPQLIIK